LAAELFDAACVLVVAVAAVAAVVAAVVLLWAKKFDVDD
jgi:nitrogen fixation-related uncharacterized protein